MNKQPHLTEQSGHGVVSGSLDDDESLSFGEVWAIVMERRWLLSIMTALFFLLGVALVVILPPAYQADGLIEVEDSAGGGAMQALKDLGPLLGLGGSTSTATQQEILNSRLVLQQVIRRQGLDIEAEPRYFPVIGAAVARYYTNEDLNSTGVGFLDTFAWGGEKISIKELEVPIRLMDEKLALFYRGSGSYEIVDDGEVVVSGRVGERVRVGGYKVLVTEIKARPGQKFKIKRSSPDEAMTAFQKKYIVKERGKKSNVLEVALQGNDRERIYKVVDDILTTYVRQNIERGAAEAANSLYFLEQQLPSVKSQLDAAESAYNKYRQSRGSLDLTVETQSLLTSVVDIDNQIVAAKQERDELRQYFTGEHPRIKAADAKLQKLQERRNQFESGISKLPDTQQTVLRLAREVEVNTSLYTNLLSTAEQLRVTKAGTPGNVRVIDMAQVTVQPVGLKRPVVVILVTILGFIAALVIVWIQRSLRVVIEFPEDVESKFSLPVYAAVPLSQAESKLSKLSGVQLLAESYPEDDAVESLRSLRTTLHFALLDSHQNSLLITGPSPGLGKSFITKNLAAVLAQVGKRVVIVDADLRRGHINKEFNLPREAGISEYVAGRYTLDEIVKATLMPNLWVVTTGQIPPNPSELLMHDRFEALIMQLSEKFDTVIVDAPPILAVSDAAIIGRFVGATLLVVRAGRHPAQEVEQSLKRLSQAGIQPKGFVFNGFDTEKQRYRYGYKGYVYRYSYKNDA
jgi:tyrosine-protein kinase Etk/Wzc